MFGNVCVGIFLEEGTRDKTNLQLLLHNNTSVYEGVGYPQGCVASVRALWTDPASFWHLLVTVGKDFFT